MVAVEAVEEELVVPHRPTHPRAVEEELVVPHRARHSRAGSRRTALSAHCRNILGQSPIASSAIRAGQLMVAVGAASLWDTVEEEELVARH